jgi:hypothetical protein
MKSRRSWVLKRAAVTIFASSTVEDLCAEREPIIDAQMKCKWVPLSAQFQNAKGVRPLQNPVPMNPNFRPLKSKRFVLKLELGYLGAALTILLSPAVGSAAQPIELAPFKEALYAIHPFDGVLRRCNKPSDKDTNERTLQLPKLGGRHVIYAFDEQTDVNGRDVPTPDGKWQNVAKEKYISRLNDSDQRNFDLKLETPAGTRILETKEVGNPNAAKFAVIFIHGAAGIYATRDLGVMDETFSGNFNRLKNMVVQNGGVYYTPSISDFEVKGPQDVTALIQHIARVAPGAPIVLSCASSGGSVCAGVANSPSAAKLLSGIIVMGSSWGMGFLGSPAYRARVPLVFAQGTCDRGNPYDRLFILFREILKRDNSYPTRFQGFADGVHGTPLRMMNWRDTLNWIFAVER